MKLQLLVSTMHQKDISICERMNISTDAIIINQADCFEYKRFSYKGNRIDFYTFNDRGVGVSRNNALMRSVADIVEFADDGMIFLDNYKEIVKGAFNSLPDADAILFNVHSLNPNRPFYQIKECKRVGLVEARNFATPMLAVKREKLLYHNIHFSLLFGGGTKYGAGEDTVLIYDMIKAGLHVYSFPVKIADDVRDKSTWFTGFNEKFFFDKGALIEKTHPKIAKLLAFLLAIKHRSNPLGWYKIFVCYCKGIEDYRRHE